MVDAAGLMTVGSVSVVAPAGHGKTELITEIAGLGRRSLILTHTHAGVHAIRARLKRHGIPGRRASVDTIAGWCMRYGHAFPGVAHPPDGLPKSGEEWDQLYSGILQALDVQAVREVLRSSYDRILIDEYQDCGGIQHEIAKKLAGIVPTIIFGDPMQGIFEFAGATLSWADDIYKSFPLYGTLGTPFRWVEKNEKLGEWIAETRVKLERGEVIDLADPRVDFRTTNSAFDMGVFFEDIDGNIGNSAAIHCNKAICYKLASAANGGYQAIEEVAAYRLSDFAKQWDVAGSSAERFAAIKSMISDCFHVVKLKEGEIEDQEGISSHEAVQAEMTFLGEGTGAGTAHSIFAHVRRHPRLKLYRAELLRDVERALSELAADRAENLVAAADAIRQRMSLAGRHLPKRTVSTPLLLKGLEFDNVVLPDATHFRKEWKANAKLFYVAISRATRSLRIASSERYIQFDRPNI